MKLPPLEQEVVRRLEELSRVHTEGDLNQLFKALIVAYLIFCDQPDEEQERLTKELMRRNAEYEAGGLH